MIYANEIAGGVLIGIASALPLIYEGRIAGVSGYAATAMRPKTAEGFSGFLFVVGLVLGGYLWQFLGGDLPNPNLFDLHLGMWALAGLLVGFGSRLSGGCTSGHGICGLGRASTRSLVSVVVFMSVAIGVTFLMRTFL